MAPQRPANRNRPREHSPYWNEVYAPIADLEEWKTDLYRHYLSAEADSDSGNWDLLLADAGFSSSIVNSSTKSFVERFDILPRKC